MSGDLRVVAQYGTPEEAHLLRNRLERAGIRVFLENETTAAWAWHFANAFGGVKLLVLEEDLPAAQQILALDDEQQIAPSGTEADARLDRDGAPDSWTCPNCRAEVDLGMDVCWACGTAGDGTVTWTAEGEPGPEAETPERGPPPAELALLTILFPPTFAYFLFTRLCHLLGPLVPDAKHHAGSDALALGPSGDTRVGRPAPDVWKPEAPEREQPGATSEEDLDALVLRAWRAALMGFFLLPPLLMTLYSIWLLVKYWTQRRGANRRSDRLARWTLALNLMALLGLALLLALIAASLYERVWHEPGTIGPPKGRYLPYLGH